MLVNPEQLALQKNKSPDGGVCPFPWYKGSRHSQYQAANVVSLNMELERDEQDWRLCEWAPAHCTQRWGIQD